MYHYGKEDLVLRESNLGASQRNLKHSDKQLHSTHITTKSYRDFFSRSQTSMFGRRTLALARVDALYLCTMYRYLNLSCTWAKVDRQGWYYIKYSTNCVSCIPRVDGHWLVWFQCQGLKIVGWHALGLSRFFYYFPPGIGSNRKRARILKVFF